MPQHVCAREGCAETFTPRKGGRPQAYCSARCRKVVLNGARLDPPRPVECAHCGVPFTPQWRKPTLYCSTTCQTVGRLTAAREAMRKFRAARDARTFQRCAECDAEFLPGPMARGQRFCAAKCKQRAGNRRLNRTRLPLTNPSPDPKTCANCGREFVPKRRTRIYCYDSYCGQSAYRKRKRRGEGLRQREHVVTCDGCGTQFVAKHPLARWCSRRCAGRHWSLVKSRQRGQLSEAKYTDREIFERDGWRCHLCGKKVRRDVDRMHPEGATIDHLIPTALGGKDEPGNVATAHRRCNRAKGTRAVGEQLALL